MDRIGQLVSDGLSAAGRKRTQMRETAHPDSGPEGLDPWAVGADPRRRQVDLLSLVPIIAIVLLVALVASLVWAVNRADDERTRTKLATDALWVEQTLRFQLSVDEDMLVRLALDQAGGTPPGILEPRARVHIAANPEVLSIVWYDPQGRILQAVPGPTAPHDDALAALVLGSATLPSRPVYGDPDAGRVSMAMRPSEHGGVVTATISLPLSLERHVPWWIAEQYAVRLKDSAGGVLAARVRRQPDPASLSHAISFDPPLRGATLEIATFDRRSAFGNTLMLGAIAGLAVFAILALLTVFRNADRRRRAELRLQGEMAFRRSMEESLTVGLRAKDHEGRVLYVNSAFCGLVGWSAAEIVGRKPPMPYWAPDRIEETMQRQRALTEGGARAQSFETRFLSRDGREIDVQVYEAPLIDARGRHRGWMGSVIDVTAEKRAARLARAQDESLARTGRLVTLGEMASTLAHELNQPLAAIASYAAGGLNLVQQGRADPALLTPALEKIALQSRRAGLIIRGIQDFVRKREPSFSEVSLEVVVAETLAFLAADARENRVRLVPRLSPVPPVLADRILIEQVLINLVRNGVEAMAEGRRSGDDLTVSLVPRPDGRSVAIEIADQGAGIPDAIADRLFDPFTSTKAQGMGMGLNICRSIVELHHGRLSHRPNPSGGTIFTVELMVLAEADAAA